MSNSKIKIKHHRNNYSKETLLENNLPKHPVKLFEAWMNIAVAKDLKEPNAMLFSTANSKGKPSSRIVLLRDFDEKGFVFYTNYSSNKGKDILSNPYAAMTFFWAELEKQVRIEGRIEKVSKSMSDAYFSSRPRESQIGAWASQQSRVIKNRQELDKRVENLTKKFEGKPVPRPDHWGGYRLRPDRIEF